MPDATLQSQKGARKRSLRSTYVSIFPVPDYCLTSSQTAARSKIVRVTDKVISAELSVCIVSPLSRTFSYSCFANVSIDHNDLIRDQSKEKLSAQLRAQEAAERHRLDAIERRRQEEAERADAEHRYQAEQESLCQERQRREDEQVQATIEQEERRKQNEEARIERGRQKAQNQARATDEAEARKEQEIEEARDVERRNRNKRAEEARIHAEEIFRQQQQREDEDKIRRQHQCENEERIRLQDEERLQRREREERKKREQIDRHLAERSRDTVGDYEDIRLRPVVNFAYTEPKPRQREDIRSRTQSVYEYERDEAYMSASPEGSPRGQTRGHSARVSESGSGISAANIFDDGDEFVAPRRSTPYIVKPYIGSRADSRPPKKKGIWDD